MQSPSLVSLLFWLITPSVLLSIPIPPSLTSEAEKTAQIREASLEQELHQRRVAAATERFRAEQLSLATVEVR